MDEERLAEIEREVAVGWTLPGRRDAFALTTIAELVAEVRRLRTALDAAPFSHAHPHGGPYHSLGPLPHDHTHVHPHHGEYGGGDHAEHPIIGAA